jgi:hypothetical protein
MRQIGNSIGIKYLINWLKNRSGVMYMQKGLDKTCLIFPADGRENVLKEVEV